MKPCSIHWCIALVDPRDPLKKGCVVHMDRPDFVPTPAPMPRVKHKPRKGNRG